MIDQYLKRLNIKELKPMQVEALSCIRPRQDLILFSPTGSGKTIAYLLPLIKMLDTEIINIQAMIVVPSRELALQIESVFKRMQTGFKVNTFYGGHPIKTEVNSLQTPPAILIGTPGRLSDHLRRGNLNTDYIHTIVLDEFDKSLELGFTEEMKFVINECKHINTRILTSATKPEEIPVYTGISNPVVLDYSDIGNSGSTEFKYIKAVDTDKAGLLVSLLNHLGDESSIVFCNHREAVERISNLLKFNRIPHGIYHGGLEQEKREVSLIKFRNGSYNILLTTDLASRGLDIPEIRNIIHYQFPVNETAWIHRNGRTARMEKSGVSWLLLTENDRLPVFLPQQEVNEVILPEKVSHSFHVFFDTLYIGLGKKDKISKGDIAGFLMKTGLVEKHDIGQIDILDHASFVAVNKALIKPLLVRIKGERIKKKMAKIEIAKS